MSLHCLIVLMFDRLPSTGRERLLTLSCLHHNSAGVLKYQTILFYVKKSFGLLSFMISFVKFNVKYIRLLYMFYMMFNY